MPIQIHDASSAQVLIPENPTRIISLVPSVTENTWITLGPPSSCLEGSCF